MDLPEELLRGIYSYGFEKPSAIQQRAIKPAMLGRDLIAQAQSGTVRNISGRLHVALPRTVFVVCMSIYGRCTDTLRYHPSRHIQMHTREVIIEQKGNDD